MCSITHAKVTELFEKHRATPGASYDEDHFIDFLLAEPKAVGAVQNSFRGLRRYNAFLDDVQYEFAVCFSLADREANYSLDKFAGRVVQLQSSHRGSLRSLGNQNRAGAGCGPILLANLILMLCAAWLRGVPWAVSGIVALTVVLNAWFLWFAWRNRKYLHELRVRIEASQ